MSTPTRIGEYDTVETLGRGDFAITYRVRAGDIDAALKWSVDVREAALQRMENEATVLRVLDHPSIPKYLGEGKEDSRPFLVMTLAPGRTLQRLLESRMSDGSFLGDVAVARILTDLLGALAYLHEKGLVHRDVKPANILVTDSESNVTLIDFGFCKPDATIDIRTADSFFRVGAARYSPPNKLMHPGAARTAHDVFAVGVLGYHLLTGQYPWSASETGDIGELRQLMLAKRYRPIHDLNSTVRPQVSGFIEALLELDDDHRATAAEARERGADVITELDSDLYRNLQPSVTHLPHVTRDPLYGDIRLTSFEREVLDCREVQRLRWIRQLGLTNMVFVGAEHTRLAHALGTVQRVEQMLSAIEQTEGVRVDPETRLTARLYALVHDVAHIPFGHSVEDELGLFPRHDENLTRIRRLVLDERSHLGAKLRENDIGRTVLSHFDPEATIQQRSAVKELVSGSTGADVLDYIDRDAYHCGLDHRIDSTILRQLRIHRSRVDDDEHVVSLLYGRHGIRIDRSFAVESVLRERYALFLKVYTHKRKAAATALLGKALSLALKPQRGKPDFKEVQLEWMGDGGLITALVGSTRAVVAALGEAIQHRHLPAPGYRVQLMPEEPGDAAYQTRRTDLERQGVFDPRRRSEIEGRIAKRAGVDSNRVILYCPPKAPGYQRVRHWVSEAVGSARQLDHVQQPFLQIGQQHLRLWELWVFVIESEPGVAPSERELKRVGEVAEDEFGWGNQIHVDRRQERLF